MKITYKLHKIRDENGDLVWQNLEGIELCDKVLRRIGATGSTISFEISNESEAGFKKFTLKRKHCWNWDFAEGRFQSHDYSMRFFSMQEEEVSRIVKFLFPHTPQIEENIFYVWINVKVDKE